MSNYFELAKLYPVKIPTMVHAEYYINTLKKSIEFEKLDHWKKMVDDLTTLHPDFSKYKFKMLDTIIDHFKSTGMFDALNNYKMPEIGLSKKDPQFNENITYISFDVREANWTLVKYALGLNEPSWSEYAIVNFDMHPALADSKSYRQLIFGNWNPKRISKIQEQYTSSMVETFKKLNANIVGINSEEVIIEYNKTILDTVTFDLPVKSKIFSVELKENYGDHIRIDSIYNDDLTLNYKKLSSVNGNRYFIHFKSIILNEDIEEKDLIFENDKKLAKWIL